MEYAALFVWLSLCLLLGGAMHYAVRSTLTRRPVQILAAPGMAVRKLSMALAAMVCGATVTRANLYDPGTSDIDYETAGPTGAARALVPLAPLFAGAMAVIVANEVLGSPLRLAWDPPSLDSMDASGVRGFLLGSWAVVSSVVRQAIRADWGNARLYVLFGLIFSFAFGACAPLERLKEALLGAGVLAVALAVLSTIAVRRFGMVAGAPDWFVAARGITLRTAGVSFVVMLYGTAAAIVVGVSVRVWETLTGAASRKAKPATPLPRDRSRSKQRAA